MKKNLYKSIFMYASLQFCGNIEEYFSKHTKKLVVFIVMPRLKNTGNIVRIYSEGKLIEEKKVLLSENIFLYYFLWFYNHWKIILKYFLYDEKYYVLTGHPVSFFGLFLQKILRRRAKYIYWIGDYFPGNDLTIKAFEGVKKFYHDKADYNLYLSDGINKVFNGGKIVDTKYSKTVMWGVKDSKIDRHKLEEKFKILFVGVIKDSQGLESVFELLKTNSNFTMEIVGVCDKRLYLKYKKIISKYKISKQIVFPNKFINDEKLQKISMNCSVGVAVYDMSALNPTYYTDPGKIKAYTQLNLPVVMTNTSGIAPYVQKFKCGEVIDNIKDLPGALVKIRSNHNRYLEGVSKFNKYFAFETYYKKRFSFMESK